MSPVYAHRDRKGERVLCGACGWGPIAYISHQRIPEVYSGDRESPLTVRWLDVGDDPRAVGDHLRIGDDWRIDGAGVLRLTGKRALRARHGLAVNSGRTWTPSSLPTLASCPKCSTVNTLDAEHLRVSVVKPGQFVAERVR